MGKYPITEESETTFGDSSSQNISKKAQGLKKVLKKKPIKHAANIAPLSKPLKRAQMELSGPIINYVLSFKSYPKPPSGKAKMKKSIEALLKQVTYMDGDDFLYSKCSELTHLDHKAPFKSAEITIDLRDKIVLMVIQLHLSLKHREETLHTAIGLMDGYCKKIPLTIKEYQLLGLTSLYVAAKYEQIFTPVVEHFLKRIDHLYTTAEVIAMEQRIFTAFDFNIGQNTSTLWYMQAFCREEFLFEQLPQNQKIVSTKWEDKENIPQLQCYRESKKSKKVIESEEVEKNKLLLKCKHVLNLVFMDYNVIKKFKEDIIAIATLSYRIRKKGWNPEKLIAQFIKHKQPVQPHRKEGDIRNQLERCINRIDKIWTERKNSKFSAIEQKFNEIQLKSQL